MRCRQDPPATSGHVHDTIDPAVRVVLREVASALAGERFQVRVSRFTNIRIVVHEKAERDQE
jgi:aromatic ring-cleaving dioxygenase